MILFLKVGCTVNWRQRWTTTTEIETVEFASGIEIDEETSGGGFVRELEMKEKKKRGEGASASEGKDREKLASDREGSVTCHMRTQFCFRVYVSVF
ncbi:hypothetical protein E5676_scaffold105G00850 [Cucumis melo var. makuwa]|uniref:Uncharacterized protein n=1 Tax=Cucumis melo var. makuwa TaxID=1194695 RepID=A0A5D3CBD9_CUCMM|nr:hypothetical protein E5676_scaffold105G00850 [Cucumis melo var. makuwa]